ncbi:MAG: hypothetical protein AMXMBFR59_20660 [Rhodanobacteraceae bacterium]
MLRSHEREKLINIAIYFANNTLYCGKIKLIKLLYLLDFEHFRQTGRSVTGLEYRAWKLGPVPPLFFAEWEKLGEDFAEAIEIVPEKVIDYLRHSVRPKRAFDDSHFSRRELAIMQRLVGRFRDEMSEPMINFTHAERGPWAKIWDSGRGDQERIPYALAVADDAPNADAVLDAADEYESIVSAVGKAH